MPALGSHKVINPNHSVHFHTCQTIIHHLAYLFYPYGTLYHTNTCTPRHAQASILPLLSHSKCDTLPVIAKWQIKYSKENYRMITIKENVATFELTALKCIYYGSHRHTLAFRVRLVKQLAGVQMICPHLRYLSRWRAFQHHPSKPYGDYCRLGA